MNGLDQNLVTTQWGILGSFGVAIALLLPRAEMLRRDFMTTGNRADLAGARRWRLVVVMIPSVLVAVLALLSIIGAHHAQLGLGGQPSQNTALLIVPVLAQIGFAWMAWHLIPRVPGQRSIDLLPVPAQPPRSPFTHTKSELRIINESRSDIRVRWVNHVGAPAQLGSDQSIDVGSSLSCSIDTYSGHCFLVELPTGVPVGVAVAAETPVEICVSSKVVDDTLGGEADANETASLSPAPRALPPSLPGGSASLIRLINDTRRPVKYSWIDVQGARQGWEEIAPASDKTVLTYVEHHFLVAAEDGTPLGLASAVATPRSIVITSKDADRAAAHRQVRHPA